MIYFRYSAPVTLGELTLALTKISVDATSITVEYVAKVDSSESENLALLDCEVLADLSSVHGPLDRLGTWYSREKESILWEGAWTYLVTLPLPTTLVMTLYADEDALGLGRTSSTIEFIAPESSFG